jgi:serine/threonine-protein kinase RsbW
MANVTGYAEEKLMLGLRLSEIARVRPWIESLASRCAIPDSVQFAIHLCLEEVLSNIVLHGYDGETEGAIVVAFTAAGDGQFVLVVDDETRHFNPLEQAELPALNPNEEIWIGGQGLRILRRFADELEYEQLPAGNRLKIYFNPA